MPLQESGEMYQETIYVLSQKSRAVRAIDVGEHMGFSKPSVSRAVSLLKAGGYVVTDEDGHLSLTEEGREVAVKIYERHRLLTGWLVNLGVDEATASVDTLTEQKIQSAIETIIKGRTSLVIAHRLSTVKNADLILVVRDGKIVGCGTHDSLMAEGGFYRELYNAQFE